MMMHTSHEGNYYNGRLLTKILTKFPQTLDTIYLETTKLLIQTSYQGGKAMKLQAKSLRIGHITNLSEAFEDSGK